MNPRRVSLVVFVLVLFVPLGIADESESSCAPIWEYADQSLTANVDGAKTLILIPYSGWGDFVRAFTNALLLSIIEGTNFKLHAVQSTQPRLAEWKCLPDQLTLATRSGFKYGVGQTHLKQTLPMWEVVKASIPTMLDLHTAPFKNITITKDGAECVRMLASTVSDVRFDDTTCQWTMSKNPKVATQREVGLATRFNVPPWKLRHCLMGFELQFLPALEDKATGVLEQLKRTEMSVNVVVIGIHIRAMRYYIGLHPESKTQAGVGVDNVFAEDARRSNHLDKLSQLDVDLKDYDSFANAAERLEENYQQDHNNDGATVVFKWIIFSDSRPLRIKLQQRWEHAADLDLGEPSHDGCSDGGLARVEWLILSKCDMLVITDSGFSRSAAMFASPTPAFAVVYSRNSKVYSNLHFDGDLSVAHVM